VVFTITTVTLMQVAYSTATPGVTVFWRRKTEFLCAFNSTGINDNLKSELIMNQWRAILNTDWSHYGFTHE